MTASKKVYISKVGLDTTVGRIATISITVTGEDIEELISNVAMVTKEIGMLNGVVTGLNQVAKEAHDQDSCV